MRLKFLLIISASYLALISGILYLGLQREKGREEFWIIENSSLQLHTINDNVGLEIEKLKAEAVKVATAMEANQKEDAVKALSHFVGISAVSAESDSYLWKIDNAKADVWNGPWFQRAKEIPEYENQPHFFAIQTQDENLGSVIRSAVFFSAKIKDKSSPIKKTVRLVGVLAQPVFQNILSSQQSAGMQFFIFSQKGLAIAHTISDYVGNSLAGDRLYEEIRKNKLALGTFTHKDFKGEAVVSMYEKIEHTDLTVVAQLRPSQWAVIDWSYYGQAYLIIFGIFCLLSGAMFFLIPKEIGKIKQIIVEKLVEKIVEKPVEKIVERIVEKTTNIPSAIFEKTSWQPPASSAPAIPAHIYEKMVRATQLEQVGSSTPKLAQSISTSTSALPTKMSILAKVISQVKGPFLSILGHVQIAKTNPQGGALQAIENETRSAREILDRLAQYSGLAQSPTVTVPLIDLVDGALRSLEGPILRGAIKISKNLSEDICIKCDPDELKMALTAIFRNSVEAMEKVLKKELEITAIKKNNSMIELRISDTGEGILPINMSHVFEPFYSTKSPLDHKGLGLAAVQGIIRTHLGEISLTSDSDLGTLVSITLPSSIEASKRLSEFQMMNRPAWMELLKTPTKQELVAVEKLMEPVLVLEPKSPETTYTIDESDVAFQLENFDFSTIKNEKSTHSLAVSSSISDSDLSLNASSNPVFASFDVKPSPKSQDIEDSFQFSQKIRADDVEPDQPALESSLLFSSPVKRLKKKSEPLDKLKVQIPRPEEKL